MLLLIAIASPKMGILKQIQIHRMLLLIRHSFPKNGDTKTNSNTSYVAINLLLFKYICAFGFYSNTSYVAINPKWCNYFLWLFTHSNTSYVAINLSSTDNGTYYTTIQIHRMLLLI